MSYGIFMCLECSGIHRGLGVHVSFVRCATEHRPARTSRLVPRAPSPSDASRPSFVLVQLVGPSMPRLTERRPTLESLPSFLPARRSVGMDSWSAIQLKKMQAGGNADLNAFLKRYGIDKHTDPKVKYNTRAAEAFKEKVAAAAEGRPWTCPTDIPMGTAPASAVPRHVGSTNSMSRAGSGASFNTAASGGDDWDWDEGGGGAARPGQEYTLDDYNKSAASKEEFFARQRALNASKPEGVRPSEGGKYVGFGSGGAPPPLRDDGIDDLLGSLGTGLSSITQQLGRVTVQAGRVAGQTLNDAGRAANQTFHEMQSGDYDQVQARAANVAQRGVEIGQKTWTGLKSMLRAGVNQLESLTNEEGSFGDGRGNGTGSGWGWGDDDDGWGGGGGGRGGGGGGGGENYTRAELERSAAGKDDFFARKQAENASRRDDLPPSRGGKYAGFGSGSAAPPSSSSSGTSRFARPPPPNRVDGGGSTGSVSNGGGFGGWDNDDEPDDVEPPRHPGVARVAASGGDSGFGKPSRRDSGGDFQSAASGSNGGGSVDSGSASGRESPAPAEEKKTKEWEDADDDWGEDDEWGK